MLYVHIIRNSLIMGSKFLKLIWRK